MMMLIYFELKKKINIQLHGNILLLLFYYG